MSGTAARIILKRGKEKPVNNRHPWIFSGAIKHAENAESGELVTVFDHKERFLGRGYWNAKSQIQVRLLTWDDVEIDSDWWRQKIQQAVSARGALTNQTAHRLINAENDFLPGLIVDQYGDWLVMQALTLYIDRHKQMIAEILADIVQPRGIYERSDVDVRRKEGLSPITGVLLGEEPPEVIKVEDLLVDIRHGHKTGTYLDQRNNHVAVTEWIPANQPSRLLNLFCYTGSFSLKAMQAHPNLTTVNVDASQDALNLASNHFMAAGIDSKRYDLIQADVFDYLRQDHPNQFDVVILDPPKFANSRGQVDQAARGYKDINLNAAKWVKSGGYLVTFSCSGLVSRDLFQKIVFSAMIDAGRDAQIVGHLSAAPDHPVAITFPEGEYLKGLILRIF